MRLLSFLVWKSWVSSPLRLLLTWFGVALGVSIVTGIHILDHNTILSQLERKRSAFGRVDLELRPRTPEPPLEERLRTLSERPDIERLGLMNQCPIELLGEGRVRAQVLLFGLAPPGAGRFGHYQILGGEDLGPLDPEAGVLLSRTLADSLGLSLGDRIEARALPLSSLTECVDGEVRQRKLPEKERPQSLLEVRGILEPLRLARRNAGLVVIGSFSLAARLGRNPPAVFQVNRAEGTDLDRWMEELSKDYLLETGRAALIGEDADERAFRNGVKVLGCLALILGMFVIFHTLSHSLAEKMQRVGILRTLGATQGQVSLVFLIDAFLLSLLGVLGGMGGGILLALGLPRMGLTTLGFGKAYHTLELPWGPMLSIAGLGVFFTMVGAAFPLLKVRVLSPRRILYVRDLAPPADLMRGVHLFLLLVLVVALPLGYLAMTPLLRSEGRGAGAVLFQLVGIVGLFFSILLLTPRLIPVLGSLPLRLCGHGLPLARFLVRKTLLRSPGRLGSAVCGLTLVSLAMLGLWSLTGALKGEIRDFSARALRGRIYVRALHERPWREEEWSALRGLPGVLEVLPLSEVHGLPFRLVGTPARALANPGGTFEGRPGLVSRLKEERSLVVSRRLAELRGLKVGEGIPLLAWGKVRHYRVLAIEDGEGFFPDERAFALTDTSWLRKDFCLGTALVRDFSLRLGPGADPGPVLKAIDALPQGRSWVQTGEDIEAFHLQDVDRDFLFFHILLLLLLILAGVGQVNLITLTTLARSREIGVLRALGLTRGDFLSVLLTESWVVGFMTGLLTLGAGLPMSWVLIRGLREVSGLGVPYRLPWLQALLIVSLAFLVSLLSALIPALRATGLPPARAVRFTE